MDVLCRDSEALVKVINKSMTCGKWLFYTREYIVWQCLGTKTV